MAISRGTCVVLSETAVSESILPTTKLPATKVALSGERSKKPIEGEFLRLVSVSCAIKSARGLPKADRSGLADPYCVVKGVRLNSLFVHLHKTEIRYSSLNPEWNEEFEFECPESWGLMELVGLRFLVYDSDNGRSSSLGSDDFLGGADVDVSDLVHGRPTDAELELSGESATRARRKAKASRKRPRLFVQVTIKRWPAPRPLAPSALLERSLAEHVRVSQLACCVKRAVGLRSVDFLGTIDAQCRVRAVLLSGRIVDLHETCVMLDTSAPVWNEAFQGHFNACEEPMLLVFDVFHVVEETGLTGGSQHLGSAALPLAAVRSSCQPVFVQLQLGGGESLLENSLTRKGARRLLRQNARIGSSCGSVRVPANQGGAECQSNFLSRASTIFNRDADKPVGPMVEIAANAARAISEMPNSDLWPGVPGHEVRADELDPKRLEEMGLGLTACSSDRIYGEPFIIFVYGWVHGATGLISADKFGKSDPYCLVDGIANGTNAKTFIHRTRVVNNNLCPSWGELFFLAVPPDADIHKLCFSIYDSDDGELGNFDEEDDFLGKAIVDLAYLANGERFAGEVPIMGCKANRTPNIRGFRRTSTVSVEIYVERRLRPYILDRPPTADWEGQPRHCQSREPDGGRYYEDPSQKEHLETSSAGHVLKLAERDLLRERAQIHVSVPGSSATGVWSSPVAEPAILASLRPLSAQPPGVETDIVRPDSPALAKARQLYDLSGVGVGGRPGAGTRTASLPALHTRFGRPWGLGAREEARSAPSLHSTGCERRPGSSRQRPGSRQKIINGSAHGGHPDTGRKSLLSSLLSRSLPDVLGRIRRV